MVVLVLARYQAKASYPRSCCRTNEALLPTRYCKHIVRGRCVLVCRLFLYSFDSATDSSGGAWLARANLEHTTLYKGTGGVLVKLRLPVFKCNILFHRKRFGNNNVILSDIRKPPSHIFHSGEWYKTCRHKITSLTGPQGHWPMYPTSLTWPQGHWPMYQTSHHRSDLGSV